MVHGLTPPTLHGGELRLARIHCQGMRELIESNPAHWHDEQALGVMRGLCKRAWAVIRDPVCRAYLAAIDDFAAALPFDSERGWSPGRMFGPWFVRREVLRKLRMLSDRLTELERDGSGSDQEVRRAIAAKELHAGGAAALRRVRYANVLRTAVDAVGGAPRLARVLRVSPEGLERWLEATEEAPLEVFLASLDLVAAGPFVPEARSARVAALPVEARAPQPAGESAPLRAGWAFDRAVVPTLLGAALIAAACLFASLPLKNALPLVAWLCIVAILLAWCASATRNASAKVRTVGQAAVLVTVCFLGASLVYRSPDPLPARAPAPTPKTIPLPAAAARAQTPPAQPPRRAASHPKVVQAVLGGAVTSTSHASAGATAPAAFDDACASLSGVASLQCRRCASEGYVAGLLCQERVRLEYCRSREGTEPLCPSAIPQSPPG
ncbi:MAG TPA: hypothetical protein VFJ70_03140 [Burkholderiales bacterium]|nr:hypothetical protein [Burkholderiales bacterium]